MKAPLFSSEDLQKYIFEIYPQTKDKFEIQSLKPMSLEMLWNISESDLRPGNTISGPSIFTLADCSFYALTLAMIGKHALTVTTNLSINFMRKAELCNLVAHTRILKMGKRLCVGDSLIRTIQDDAPIAHASITYSLPNQQ